MPLTAAVFTRTRTQGPIIRVYAFYVRMYVFQRHQSTASMNSHYLCDPGAKLYFSILQFVCSGSAVVFATRDRRFTISFCIFSCRLFIAGARSFHCGVPVSLCSIFRISLSPAILSPPLSRATPRASYILLSPISRRSSALLVICLFWGGRQTRNKTARHFFVTTTRNMVKIFQTLAVAAATVFSTAYAAGEVTEVSCSCIILVKQYCVRSPHPFTEYIEVVDTLKCPRQGRGQLAHGFSFDDPRYRRQLRGGT